MEWTAQKPPTEGTSYYNHTTLKTPLGVIIIEWKGWKESPSYDITMDNEWIGCEYDLDSAKESAIGYLKEKQSQLNEFLSDE